MQRFGLHVITHAVPKKAIAWVDALNPELANMDKLAKLDLEAQERHQVAKLVRSGYAQSMVTFRQSTQLRRRSREFSQ